MNALRDKSHFNRQAADLCLKNNLYAPSIHCSYYSCVQYMLYVLFEKLNMTEKTFLERRSLWNLGTHACVFKLIGLDLINKHRQDYKYFQKLVPELRVMREKSDYHNELVHQEEGHLALNKSDSIKHILSTNYK